MKKLLLIAALACLQQMMFAQALLDKSQWDAVFVENFDYTSITDPLFNSRWNLGWPGSTPCRFYPSTHHDASTPYWAAAYNDVNQLSFAGGKAIIKTTRVPQTIVNCRSEPDTFYYKTATLISKLALETTNCGGWTQNGISHGMIEVRMKLSQGVGAWPTLFLTSMSGIQVLETNFSDGGPIDYNYFWQNYDGSPCLWGTRKITPNDLSQEFHTYAVVWSPTTLTFFFDGKETVTVSYTRSDKDCARWMVLESGAVNYSTFLESTFEIDNIVVYKPKSTNPSYECKQYASNVLDNTTEIKTPVVSNASNSIASTADRIYYKTSTNQIANYYYCGGTSYCTAMLGTPTDVKGSLLNFGNRVYYIDISNRICYYQWSGTAWVRYITTYLASGDLVATSTGEIFFHGLDNKVWGLNPTVIYAEPKTSAICKDNVRISPNGNVLFFRGLDNNAYFSVWSSGSGYSTPINITGSGDVGSTMVVDFNINKLYYKSNTSSQMYNCYYTTTWNNVPIYEANNVLSDIVMDLNHSSTVYYRGTDNRIWCLYQDNGFNSGGKMFWYIKPIDWSFINCAGPIYMKSDGTLVYRTTSNSIAQATWRNGSNVNPTCSTTNVKSYVHNVYRLANEMAANIMDTKISSIYPNPATTTFRINGNSEDSYSVSIVDMQGKLLYSDSGLLQNINAKLPVISSWNNGVYIVRIKNNSTMHVEVEKLVKQ